MVTINYEVSTHELSFKFAFVDIILNICY
jgi:hypothetical protein